VRLQVQDAAIVPLQETRTVQLEKQAQTGAELEGMQTSIDGKVTSYQSTVAQRANEASSFNTWTKTNDDYAKVLEGVVDMMAKKKVQLGDGASGIESVQGVIKGMKMDVESKKTELTKKHAGSDSDYLTLVTSYRKSLSDSQAAYSTKRIEMETAQIAARDAGDERDVRKFVNKGESDCLEILIHICADNSGKLQRTITEGDNLLTSVVSRVSSTVTDMNAMPETVFLQLGASPVTKLDAQRDEMKRLAAEVKAKQGRRPRVFKSARTTAKKRQTITVKMKPTAPPTNTSLLRSGGARTKIKTVVRALDASAHLAKSAVVVAKRVVNYHGGPTTTIEECVTEKQRLASEITAARSAKEEAETQKKLADTRGASLTTQITICNTQKKELNTAYNGFSSTWLPLMTMVGTDSWRKEINTALANVDAVESDVNTYTSAGGPPGAFALPTALNNVRAAIKTLRDGLQTDLSNVQGLFTGSLMTVYPRVTNELTTKVTDLEAKKTKAAQDAGKYAAEVSKQTALVNTHKNSWDQAVKVCEPLLKGK